MENNTPIPDAELAELRRLHAAAKLPDTINIRSATIRVHPLGPDVCSSDEHEASLAALYNAFPAILARLEAAERERDELECEVEELKANSIEYEKDCTKALCSLAREFDYEWDSDGATADDLREFISTTLDELTNTIGDLAARDARMKREGAAQGIEQAREMLSMAESGEEADEMMRQAAKRLREGK